MNFIQFLLAVLFVACQRFRVMRAAPDLMKHSILLNCLQGLFFHDDAPFNFVSADCSGSVLHGSATGSKYLHAAIHGRQARTHSRCGTCVADSGRNCSATTKIPRARIELGRTQGGEVGRPGHAGQHKALHSVMVSNELCHDEASYREKRVGSLPI